MAKAALKAKHFRWPGGVLGTPRQLIRSSAYRALSPEARCLLIELHDVWQPDKPIHFSTRRLREALGISQTGAVRAFREALELGFVRLANESDWLNGKAREWILTWMPYNGREPTADWISASEKLCATNHQSTGQGSKRTTRVPVKPNGRKLAKSPSSKNNDLRAEQISISQKSEPPEYHH